MGTDDSEEVDLRQYLKVLFHRRWWAIGIFLVVVTATAYITFNTTPMYRTERADQSDSHHNRPSNTGTRP